MSIKPLEEKLLELEGQRTYDSGVGILLYLLKHSRPNLSNPVQEISKTMDGANPAQHKELLHVTKFVLGTEMHGLKFLLITKEIWIFEGLSDAYFASDKDKHICVTGFTIYFMGILVSWQSQGQ